MQILRSAADVASDSYLSNAAAQRALVDELRERLATAALGGPERSRERHLSRGKLLPRERIDELLDPLLDPSVSDTVRATLLVDFFRSVFVARAWPLIVDTTG